MFDIDNLKEGQSWLEKQRNALTKLSEITTTGETFILFNNFLKKALIAKVLDRKVVFGEGDIFPNNSSIFRKELLGYRVVPPEKVQEFENALKKIGQLYNLECQAIDIVDKLSSNGFRRIKDLSPQDQQKFVDLFSE
jgi:hypothetical protein